jgi:hypothetical protein
MCLIIKEISFYERRIMKQTLTIISLMVLFSLSLFGQGLYWESTAHLTVMGNDREINSKFYAMPKMFKSVDGEQHEAIIRLDKGVILNINHEDKTYTEMTFDELNSMMKKGSEKLDKSMAELKDRLKDMPEEQRKMVEQMMSKNPVMGGGSDEKYTVKNAGKTEKINGYNCSKYIVSQGDKDVLTVWATKDVKGPESLKKDLQDFRERLASTMPRIGSAMAEGMKNVDGFPIRVESANYKSVVTKIEHKSTPSSSFEAPKGYKKTKPASLDDMDEGKE